MEKLISLQSDVINSQNKNLISKVLPILLDQLIDVYEANVQQELELVEFSLGRIEGALELNRESQKQRAWARTLTLFVPPFVIGLLIVLIRYGPTEDYVIPIIKVPLPILVWSAIGSFSAILYRFNKSGDMELQDPLRWLVTLPVTGVVMGIIAFFVLKIGFLSISAEDEIDYGSLEVLWLIAFISGFSDRFSDTILKTLIGKFGGDSGAEILSNDSTYIYSSSSSLQSLVDEFLSSNQSSYKSNMEDRGLSDEGKKQENKINTIQEDIIVNNNEESGTPSEIPTDSSSPDNL